MNRHFLFGANIDNKSISEGGEDEKIIKESYGQCPGRSHAPWDGGWK